MPESPLIESYRMNERDLVRFLARRLKCIFTAHDLAHEIYLKLHSLDDAVAIGNPKAYLFRIAANLATDHLRTENRRSAILAEAHDMLWGGTAETTPEQSLIAREELARLRAAVAELSPTSRQIFFLNRFGGKTQREIAAAMGVSLTTVEKHIRKALHHLAAARDR